jgi:hypothetical protein
MRQSLKTILNDRLRMKGSGTRMMMAFEGEGSAGAKREWVAVMTTTIKASVAASSTLAEHEKMTVARGARLTGVIEAEDQGHWTIADSVSGDAPLPEGLRFLYKSHWELQPEAATETPSLQKVKPSIVSSFHNEPSLPTRSPVPERAESVVLPPASPPAVSRVIEPAPAPSKPVNHRRLFALFKRDAKKKS